MAKIIKQTRLQHLKEIAFAGTAGNVFRGMAPLAMGSGIARVIGFAAIPIITRLYTPEHFGVMAVFIALVGILAPILTLRYVLAVPLPRHDGLAMNLMVLSVGLMLATGTVLTFGLALWAEPVLAFMSMEILAPWWWLIVLGLLGAGSFEILSLWATRRRDYRTIARTSVTQSAAGAVVKIGCGYFGAGPIGLLIGQVVAKSGGIGIFLRKFSGEFRANWKHVRVSRIIRVAKHHRGFPIYRLPSQLLLGFSTQAPAIFAAALFGSATAGQLGLALTVIALPMTLIGQAIGTALYGEAAKIGAREPGRLLSLVVKVQVRLFVLAMVPAIVLFVYGPTLFGLVFGSNWEQAGHFVSLLAIYILFQFVAAPVMQIINLLNRQHIFLLINIARAASLVGLGFAAQSLNLNAEVFVASYSILAAIIYVAISAYITLLLHRALSNSDSRVKENKLS